MYARSEFNTVRLILGKDFPEDNDSENRYTRACSFLKDWSGKGVLAVDAEPCFYFYEQVFRHPEHPEQKPMIRRALFALIRLENFSEGNVLPHEKTYSKPKADRLKLVNATETSLSPVFGLYEDKTREIGKIFCEQSGKVPLAEVRDTLKADHRLWKVSDPAVAGRIEGFFKTRKIVIADGHHRYETGINHRDEKGVHPRSEHPCNYTLIALVDADDEGLLVMPTHRMVRHSRGFSREKFLGDLAPYFEVKTATRDEVLEFIQTAAGEEKGFGLCFEGGKNYLARLKSLRAVEPLMPAGKCRAWCELEVSLVTYTVIEKVLGLEEQCWHDSIVYTHDAQDVFRKMDAGGFDLAFLLRSIPVPEIFKVCGMKELLPHKSTYFYPKLPSGLLFYPHQFPCEGK